MKTLTIKNHEQIFELLFDKDEITWQSMLFELVRTEKMDPWDIDVSLLTQKYLEVIKKLKQFDFRISGKMLLAAAILLRIKSTRLMGEDLEQLDKLFSGEEIEDELSFEETAQFEKLTPEEKAILIPKTPQPRKRKVSIFDLVNALERALETKRRRVLQSIPPIVEIPQKKRDITDIIKDVYGRIIAFFRREKGILTFSKLIPSDSKQDKVYTFIPLLHLSNQRRIDLFQEQHFGEIEIIPRTSEAIEKELSEELKV